MPYDIPLRILFKALQETVYQLATSVATLSGGSVTRFDTVADMLAADPETFAIGLCHNYETTDGIVSMWVKSDYNSQTANGTDILASTEPSSLSGQFINFIRVYVRESL